MLWIQHSPVKYNYIRLSWPIWNESYANDSERGWERERQNDSIVLKDLNKKWKRYTKYRNIEAAKQINKNKRFLYFIGWFENVWLTFPRRARIFFSSSFLNVPLKFVAGDVKDAYSQNVWILFKGHTNITSSLLSKRNLLDNSQWMPIFSLATSIFE